MSRYVYMYCTDESIYLYIWLFLFDCLFSVHFPSLPIYIREPSLYVSPCMLVCPCVCYHQQSAAFNEVDGRKINIVPLKMISSHPFIASHFHPFIVWERVHWSTERKFESLHPSVNISLSSFMPLFSFIHSSHHSCALWALFLTSRQLQWYNNAVHGKYVSFLVKNKWVNCNALHMCCCRRGVVYSTPPSSLSAFSKAAISLFSCHVLNWFDISCLWPKETQSLDEPTNKSGGCGVCMCV